MWCLPAQVRHQVRGLTPQSWPCFKAPLVTGGSADSCTAMKVPLLSMFGPLNVRAKAEHQDGVFAPLILCPSSLILEHKRSQPRLTL